ncbi:antibiotic biosynthesis monooxygenase [Paenibacillus sp. J5C_2022]|uniref:antibiotic biosynthesis monooxygenase n=1 Tax=Paenibacillus sp. J5C2022 TaxID=2977129 RepID=UPI0021D301AC|nr:antibiotic biosynthesis monooxygenase [Paenibacillus sp. J5C2022]MCU6708273.1 antibiotic biosynthesis monooxygenase [Paenibacillus sp. J5C2022]
MLIQIRTIVVQSGHADKVVERFSQPGHIETMKGLIDRTVMVNKRNKDSEEVVAMIRWESEEAWKNWEKDPVHIAGHKAARNDEKPSYLIRSTVKMYDVKTVRPGTYDQQGE